MSELKINDPVYIDLIHSGAVGNGTIKTINLQEDGTTTCDIEFVIIPKNTEDAPQHLIDMGFKTTFYGVDVRLISKIEYEHAHADLPVEDESVQDAVVVDEKELGPEDGFPPSME